MKTLNIFIIAQPYIDKYLRPPAYLFHLIRRRLWDFLERRPLQNQITGDYTALPYEDSEKNKKAKSAVFYQLGQQVLFSLLGISGIILTLYLHHQGMQDYIIYSGSGTAVSFLLLLYRSFRPLRL